MRSRLCELHRAGISYGAIHRMHPEIPIGTIKTTCRREKDRVDNMTQRRLGRPRALSEEDRDFIFDLVVHTHPGITCREILDLIDHKINDRALRMLLKEMGIVYRTPGGTRATGSDRTPADLERSALNEAPPGSGCT